MVLPSGLYGVGLGDGYALKVFQGKQAVNGLAAVELKDINVALLLRCEPDFILIAGMQLAALGEGP